MYFWLIVFQVQIHIRECFFLPGWAWGRETLGGDVIFFPLKEGGCNFFWYSGDNSKILSGGEPPDPPPCITIYIISSWYHPLLLKRWKTLPQYLQAGRRGGGCDFLGVIKRRGVVIFSKTRVQNSHPPPSGNKRPLP